MGGYAQGGTLAAPIFKQFAQTAFKDMPVVEFRAPPGIRMVRIDRRSGKRVYGVFPTGSDPKPAVIWEAFKPESEPRRTATRYDVASREDLKAALERAIETRQRRRPAMGGPAEPADSDFLQREGGIY